MIAWGLSKLHLPRCRYSGLGICTNILYSKYHKSLPLKCGARSFCKTRQCDRGFLRLIRPGINPLFHAPSFSSPKKRVRMTVKAGSCVNSFWRSGTAEKGLKKFYFQTEHELWKEPPSAVKLHLLAIASNSMKLKLSITKPREDEFHFGFQYYGGKKKNVVK
jgi:hypothetical protein